MTSSPAVTWVATTRTTPWTVRESPGARTPTHDDALPNVLVQVDQPQQVIEGFGACFSELSWQALQALDATDRDGIFRELFAPGVGGNFTLCRTPLGASDFSLDWYSFDEVPGDFDLEHFSIERDHQALIPFIREAQKHQPALRLWASPWSPPTWMKTNGHYAGAVPSPWLQGVRNGLAAHQEQREGQDTFIQEPRYFRSYAAYFGRFVDAYRQQGIEIRMVMPQNEFNSPQPFPSCTWTPNGLARFLGHLGPEMQARGVEIFIGTLERPDDQLIEASLSDPDARAYVKGAGFQWAGKGAIAAVHRTHPELRLYQTEQECGDGRNDWRYCRYAWTMLRHYVQHGVNAYMYWNIALERGGVSRWGWAQNSLITVDREAKTFTYNHEYHLLKHVTHFVQPGARVLPTLSWTGHEHQLAFLNPDGSVVVVMHNDLHEALPVTALVGDHLLSPILPADSFNTFLLPAAGR